MVIQYKEWESNTFIKKYPLKFEWIFVIPRWDSVSYKKSAFLAL